MRILLLITLISFAASALAEMYRWTDEKGRVHFSDTAPDKAAQPYEPKPIQTVPALAPSKKIKSKKKKTPTKYQTLSIRSPKADDIFTPDKTSVTVNIYMKPGLTTSDGHVLALLLNGKEYGKGSSFNYQLNNLPRGTHSVQAVVYNDKGKTLISSEPVSFHVQRHHR